MNLNLANTLVTPPTSITAQIDQETFSIIPPPAFFPNHRKFYLYLTCIWHPEFVASRPYKTPITPDSKYIFRNVSHRYGFLSRYNNYIKESSAMPRDLTRSGGSWKNLVSTGGFYLHCCRGRLGYLNLNL